MGFSRAASAVLRLYLVRHGETEANVQAIVVGQDDSPLTELGIQQAQALGKYCDMLRPCSKFDQIHVSDLPRTQRTARIIMEGMTKDSKLAANGQSFDESPKPAENMKYERMIPNTINLGDSDESAVATSVLIDARLREVAKGAREGFHKSVTYDDALSMRAESNQSVPKLESYDDVWDRLYSWIYDIIWAMLRGDGVETTKHVLAVSHAGSLRLLLQKLVPDSHPLLNQSEIPEHTSQPRADSLRFPVPNTSLTILELVVPRESADDTMHWPTTKPSHPPVGDSSKLWTTKVIELTWTGHYDHLSSRQCTTTTNEENES